MTGNNGSRILAYLYRGLKEHFLYKQILAFILIAAFLGKTMDSSLIILDYYIQPARYEKYCINKDKPQMHCNGKCQMIKRIKTEEKRDQDNPERRNKNEITLSARSFFPSIIAPVLEPTVIPKTPLYSGGNIIDRSLDIFHPPQV